ncbi:MAG: hypothetical protein JO031_00675 [Ktedonobacteraceae bacterium]|nr:hypothetical protein [Ktedonobacteraceae bacterium]
MSWVYHQPPVFLSANQIEEEEAEEEAMIRTLFSPVTDDELKELQHNFRRVTKVHEDQFPSMGSYINEIEQLIGPVPLSIRAWYEVVGGVNFSGFHAEWQKHAYSSWPEDLATTVRPTLIYACDPLQIYPLDSVFMTRLRQKHMPGEKFLFEFAPDRSFKDNYGGAGTPYAFFLPDMRADAWLVDLSRTFVQYLRMSILQWAGFPGMAEWRTVPEEDLAFLTHDLLPF